jgi:putative component of membrane protein insertase Oxa1/YidC/SpoIIIJ protein YidD
MKSLSIPIILLILFYRRFISPQKGWKCAYAQTTSKGSCSDYGLRFYKRYGLAKGTILLNKQFIRCQISSRRFQRGQANPMICCALGAGPCESKPSYGEPSNEGTVDTYTRPTYSPSPKQPRYER